MKLWDKGFSIDEFIEKFTDNDYLFKVLNKN